MKQITQQLTEALNAPIKLNGKQFENNNFLQIDTTSYKIYFVSEDDLDEEDTDISELKVNECYYDKNSNYLWVRYK